IVLGDEARRTLFSGRPAVGSTILLNGVRFQVVGTLQRIGHGDNNNQNLKCFVPYNTMREYFPPTNVGEAEGVISLIEYQPKSRALHETAMEEVHRVIARNHGFDANNPESFDEWDTVNTVDQVGKIFDAMNVFLGSVGLVTLGLGAIGIINIMLVAVADRTQEIGLGEGFDPPKLVARTAALAVVSLAVAGVAAGLYPARRAALLQPVEALRKE